MIENSATVTQTETFACVIVRRYVDVDLQDSEAPISDNVGQNQTGAL